MDELRGRLSVDKACVFCLVVVVLFVAGCSDEGGDGGAAGGGGSGGSTSGGGGTAGAAGNDGGAQCNAVTGTYALTGTRDSANPGSCPNQVAYASPLTATVQAEGAGYKLSLKGGSNTNSSSCVVNVSGCLITANCKMATIDLKLTSSVIGYDSAITWTVTSTGLSGSEEWTNFSGTTPSCSANWGVIGVRQ